MATTFLPQIYWPNSYFLDISTDLDYNILTLMENEHHKYDPLTSIADKIPLWNMEEGVVLSDKVLNHVFTDYINRYPKTILAEHCAWLLDTFPEIKGSSFDKQNPIKNFSGVLQMQEVKNSGSVFDARAFCSKQVSDKSKVVYWTGGLEFTKAHYNVAKHLLANGNKILIGLDNPTSLLETFYKKRGRLWSKEVPFSLWSKLLKENGFIFPIPSNARPKKDEIFGFYFSVYSMVTGKKIPIVVSEADQFTKEKTQMGPVIEVPFFDEPSATKLYESVSKGIPI